MESRTFDKSDLHYIGVSLKEQSEMMYYTGDLSDCGNEIGIMVGSRYDNLTQEEIDELIVGIRHGISLTNGTH